MGLSIGDLLKGAARGAIAALPIPGAPQVASILPLPGGGSSVAPINRGDNPMIPDIIEEPLAQVGIGDFPGVASSACGDIPVTVTPMVEERLKAPPGYVIVKCGAQGQKVAMLKPVARSLGLWKPRAKPLMTAGDAKCLRRAERLVNKVKRINKMADMRVPSRKKRG